MKIELRTALELKNNAFIGEIFEELVFPEGMVEIPGSLCEDCCQLRKVVLPSTIKRIDVGAFCGCNSLKSLEIPISVKEIGFGIVSAHENFEGICFRRKRGGKDRDYVCL